MRSTLPFGSGFEMVGLATNLAQHGAFANPLSLLPTGPSAAAPPLYPTFLALVMKALRGSEFVVLAVAIANAVANAISAALLPRISLLICRDAAPGIIASIFWLLSARLIPSWDVNFTVSAVLLFVLYSSSVMSKAPALSLGVATGILAGLLLLLNPMTLLIFLPWQIHLLVIRNASLKRSIAYGAIVSGVMASIVFPWMLRNHHEVGGFVMRTGLGRAIYTSNVDCSKTSLVEDLRSGCAATYLPTYNLEEAAAFRDLGEVNYDRVRMTRAKAWIRSHPKRFLQLTISRIVAFWFPCIDEYPFKTIMIWTFTLISIPGLILMARHRVPATIFAGTTLLLYPPVYYLIVSDVRYRYPILWLSLLPAGYFVVWILRRWQARQNGVLPGHAES